MEIIENTAYGGSSALVKVLASTGIKEFYLPQVSALKAGLLNSYSILIP